MEGTPSSTYSASNLLKILISFLCRKVDHRTSQRHRSAAILDIAMDRTERVCVRQNVKDFSVADEIKESPDFSPCAFHIGYSCVGYMETTNSKSAPNVLVVKTPTR